jgi:dienelactone hydrolase
MAARVFGSLALGGAAVGGGGYLLVRSEHPRFFSPLGPYPNVAAFHCRCGAVGAQVFYPAIADKHNTPRAPYLRDGVLQCLAEWLEFRRGMFFMLEGAPHPCLDGMLATGIKSLEGGEKLPVIIFQHGLGGTSEFYSQLCLDYASFGFVVVALEHEDGSGVYAMNSEGILVRYKDTVNGKMTDESKDIRTRYIREEVIEYRRPFLKQRVAATESAITRLQSASSKSKSGKSSKRKRTNPHASKEDAMLERVLQNADTNSFFLVGHSFGAASSVVLAQLPHVQVSQRL